MLELEFLPDWYPQTLRRQRLLRLEASIVVGLMLCLAGWGLIARSHVSHARAELARLHGQMSRTGMALERLDDLLALQKSWRIQDQIVARLGPHVDCSRILTALDKALPASIALTDLRIETRDQTRPINSLSAAARAANGARTTAQDAATPRVVSGTAAGGADTAATPLERCVRITLEGVAPTDVDLADFLARLTAEPLFEQVSMAYARDRVMDAHVLREFQISFSMDLGAVNGS